MICGSVVVALLVAATATVAPGTGRDREAALLQTWGRTLDGDASSSSAAAAAKDTPVTRVVALLKQMQKTLQKEMDEDAALYDKLACWCNTNKYEKGEAITEAQAKIADLKSTQDALESKTAGLKQTIEQLEKDTADGKSSLEAAAALREKEQSQFHGSELESIQSIEALKAAIEVLSKHQGAALPQMALNFPSASFLSVRGTGRKGRGSWDGVHESRLARSFDDFLETHGFTGTGAVAQGPPSEPTASSALQRTAVKGGEEKASASKAWSSDDTAILQRALRTASTFMQARGGEDYYPSYRGRSGEIVGLLKELKDQMEADLSEAQKTELSRKAAYEELRSSKSTEVEEGEKQAEQKEDQLAKASMDLAEAKEDLSQTEATLSEQEKFVATLRETCEDADTNFEARKSTRLEEIKAVSEAVSILSKDEARDTMSRTYSFLQMSSIHNARQQRVAAASVLRAVAARQASPVLSIMATRVQLDNFERVKKAIDDMVLMLKTQQADEVKKNDWCNAAFHENEVSTVKTESDKADLSAKADDLTSSMQKLDDEVAQASKQIVELQVELQRATENRQRENLDFQNTIADQRATQAALKQALERLAKFYSSEDFLQKDAQRRAAHDATQTPPVPQKEYNPSAGGNGVMSMIEKLIYEARALETESRKGENKAQSQYETLLADTNASIKALQKEVAFKTGAKADASKEKTETESDLVSTVGELEALDKYKGTLHFECDYLVKNFGLRQEARAQEVEALKQAKQILSGAAQS
jgi:hypothetical protein